MAGREPAKTTAASAGIDEELMTGATVANDVFLTARTADNSIVFATVVSGTVTNGQLSPNAVVQFSDGSTAKAAVMYNGIIRGWQLAKNSVTTAKILDAAVTKAKLANGAVTEVKILNGTIKSKKIARGQIKAVHLASGSVITAKVAGSAVTEPKIADGAVTNGKIANSSITSDKIASNSILPRMIDDGAITSSGLANGSVNTDDIANGAVTEPKIADGAVTAAKLANLSITAAKIATGTITASQIASDGGVVKSIVGNSIVAVTNNNNGSYSIALTTSCTEGQILKFTGGQWQCASDADTGYYTPQDILRFPRVGSPQTDWYDNSTTDNPSHPTEPNYLLYLGAGQSGVVREVWSVGASGAGGSPVFTNWTEVDNYELRVYTGAGNVADTSNPPAQYLTAQIPLGMLMGGVYHTARTANVPVETALLDYARSSVASPATNTASLDLHIPIPFENGILIQIWKRSPSAPSADLSKYHWVSYEVGTTSFPYQTWRLKASSVRQTLKDTNQNAEFINVSGKAGMLLGLYSSIKPVGDNVFDLGYNEVNWTFYPDGNSQAAWQTSGTEDLFGINPFYYASGQVAKQYWGTTYFGGAAETENYRIFTQTPLIWTTGLRGVYPNPYYNPSGAGDDAIETRILALYYAEK